MVLASSMAPTISAPRQSISQAPANVANMNVTEPDSRMRP